MTDAPAIAILGASGLIGHGLVLALERSGFRVVPVARRFTDAQLAAHRGQAVTADFVDMPSEALRQLIEASGAEIVVNCVGVLQDAPGRSMADAHAGFVARLLDAVGPGRLLVHLSIPEAGPDTTPFSRTKRNAEHILADSGQPFAILRPGFVLTHAAYGGSALLRALAMWPVDLPRSLRDVPLAATDLSDIAETIAWCTSRWTRSHEGWTGTWDILSDETTTVGDVLDGLRRHFGGPRAGATLPVWLLRLGARLGDAAALLGWLPPVRTTALAELQRGVAGDASPWRATTGIAPRPLRAILGSYPASVQERWFGRLYLLKPAVVVVLALFWIATGALTLVPGFTAAASTLVRGGVPPGLAEATTLVTSLLDIGIGAAIAFRRTYRSGLVLGIGLSLAYMAGATILVPELWLDPLGPLMKIWPAIGLMVVGLAVCDDR